MIRRTTRTIRARYQRSWFGQKVHPSNGLILLIFVAIVGLSVAVPFLNEANSEADRRRDCIQRAENGAAIDATGMAGVEHAEETAHLMATLRDLIVMTTPPGVPGHTEFVETIDREVDDYVEGVAQFRAVAEAYEPTTYADCGVNPPNKENP